jgi:hypothetical protein
VTSSIEDARTAPSGTTQPRADRLARADAYDVLLHILAVIRCSGRDRTTTDDLDTAIRNLPGSARFGGRHVLHSLLREAAEAHAIRISAAGHILLRSDAPSDGGPEHTWIRFENRADAEVEVVGADPWPDHQQHAPGAAWWRCTGCRMSSGPNAQDLDRMRSEATAHARDCHARPAPVAAHAHL